MHQMRVFRTAAVSFLEELELQHKIVRWLTCQDGIFGLLTCSLRAWQSTHDGTR